MTNTAECPLITVIATRDPLVVHCLEVELICLTPLVLGEYAGAAVRGAIFNALWGRFCTNKAAPACADCPLMTACPVASLVAPLREENARGQDIPRPYVITPPTGGRYAQGDTVTFGLTLFGSIVEIFPYLVLALELLAEAGIGQRLDEAGARRGRLQVRSITATNILTGQRQAIYQRGLPRIERPMLPITNEDVVNRAERLPVDRLTLTIMTPMRLIEGGGLVRRLTARVLVQRLIERFDALCREYGDGSTLAVPDREALIAMAGRVINNDDRSRWVEVQSYSARQRRLTPISGLVGSVTLVGELASLRTILVWGELIRAGKNAVKGAGWYRLEAVPDQAANGFEPDQVNLPSEMNKSDVTDSRIIV